MCIPTDTFETVTAQNAAHQIYCRLHNEICQLLAHTLKDDQEIAYCIISHFGLGQKICFRSTGHAHIRLLGCTQMKMSSGKRSGVCGSHGTGPPLPIICYR